MESSLEQRYAIKFCFRLGKSPSETFAMLQQVFGPECLSYSQVKKWNKAFREGREEVTDEPRSGRPSSARTDVNVQRVREVLNTGRRLSHHQVAEALKRLKRSVARKRRDIKDSWKLHHDNAPSHTAFIVTDYLVRVNVPVVPQPPYSPDLSPPDFFLFPSLK